MKIINQSRNTLLAQEAILAETLFSRIRGLLGRKNLEAGQALILEPCNSIHTLFMRFPIDVLFVDKDSRIIQAISSLKPFRFSAIYFNSKFVIELPAGLIQASLTSKGDSISITPY